MPEELAFQALESFVEIGWSAYSDSSLQAASLTILESYVAIYGLKIRAPEVTPFTVTAPPPATLGPTATRQITVARRSRRGIGTFGSGC